MTSVLDEIRRIQSAKTDIEEAIEYCGVNIPDTALIDTYASYIKSIPDTLFTTLNYDQIGGDDFYIKTIKQSNGLINATTGGCVSSTSSGLAPKIGTSAASTISAQDNEWVLTSTQGGSPTWRKLPNNAFENDNTNTTYALSGVLSANTYITTLTDSASGKTTATIPAMSGASSTAAGTAGLVPAPAANKHTAFLRGDGTWVVPTNYYRPISVNGTSILENNNTALNLVAGANISITAENSSGYTGKVTITNTGVHSTTINGNYLRVNTNGTNADLTIPYATSAGTLGGFTISNFMIYGDHTNYVTAGFTDENLSKKAAEKYIEYWDNAGGWFNSTWGKVTAHNGFVGNLTGTASYATSAGNADTVDGYHASSLWRSDGATWNPTANITMTPTSNGQEWSFDFRSKGSYTGSHWHVWDESKNTLLRVDADSGAVSAPYGFVGNLSGNATYANSAGSASYAHYLPTKYDGGQQTNPQKYFNNDIGLRVAMTGMSSKGTSYWSDTLWINGYSGGDVQQMCALHFNRDGTPRAFISAQSNQSTSYGTFYELITGYNIGSQSVNYANSAGTASKVTCTEASGDTPRPIVGIVNSQLYYTSKVTIRWDNGNVTAPTFTGRLIGSADKVNGYTIWTGTQAQYNAATKNNNTIYLIY